jgi:methyltransferase (TIGR00027 family)
VREGTASRTARGVAALRLEYDRVATDYGDAAADEALSRDVADGLIPQRTPMREYLRARTAFFDRVVVNALERGVTQVVIGGAGYDGRAFRYARPGVRWFEVDHPATQADKRARVTRLGLDAAHIAFVTADFTADPVAGPLRDAGLDPASRALFLFEGVAVYLDRPVIERVLAEFRAATTADSLLAISMSTGTGNAAARARFQARVAAIGEPARTVLAAGEAAALLAAAGWELREASERQRFAGLLLARAATARPATERVRGALTRRASPSTAQFTAAGPSGRPRLGATAAEVARLPLSALLSQALVAFTVEADNEAEHRIPHRTAGYGATPDAPPGAPWITSLLMWANCLRHLPDAGVTVAELRDRARTSTNLDGMRRWGYVSFTPDPGRGKRPRLDTVIAPTGWGIVARDTWDEVVPQVEARWRDRLGADTFATLRAALDGVVAHLDPALPDCLPILRYGLFSGPDQAGRAGRAAVRKLPPGGPSAGPGASPPPSPAGGLPLWALLSRTLLAFATQYEAMQYEAMQSEVMQSEAMQSEAMQPEKWPGPSLALSANVLRVLTESGVATSDIPALGGVSRESVAMAARWLRGAGLATEGHDPAASRLKIIRLTPRGAAARDEYPARAAGIERDWRARFGDGAVTALRRAVEPLLAGEPPPLAAGLEPYPDNWRARRPPPATLPHYPVTLHRGGYPDGS